jgi:predicted dehydrogenase
MASSNDQKKNSGGELNQSKKNVTSRRTVLKTLAGIPVLGAFGLAAFKSHTYAENKKNLVIKELGLDNLGSPAVIKNTGGNKGELIRIGIIGFGNRASQLSSALGFLHPSEIERRKRNGTLEGWLEQDNLNVAVTGICDVFDLHAENGLATAGSELRPGGGDAVKLPVRKYSSYQDLLADKDIDAVIIATPDHHHARFSIDAIKAGKHVYCEKSTAHYMDELNELYDVVRSNNKVYQLGHQITQNTIYQQAKEIIERNILGKISLITTTTNRNTSNGAWIRHLDANGNPKPGDEKSIDWKQWLGESQYVPFSIDRFYNWTKWFDYDTGLLGQLFSHEFDAINQILGMGIPHSAVSSGGIYYWKDNREMPDVLNTVLEYPARDLALTYSATLANGRSRGRMFMGHDASMELGQSISITADRSSTRYRDQIASGIIDTNSPMISIRPGTGRIDAVTSATERYYAERGLTTTTIGGRAVDVTHLHVKEWVDCIRNGGTPTVNIEPAYEVGVAILMAHQAYVEKRRVEWDPVQRKIV